MKSKEILSAFEKEVKQNKISASYLFYGDKRVDLLFYALEFSKMVMTANLENEEEKKNIEKRIENFQYPDIEVINKKNENIKIYKTEKLDKEYKGQNGQIVDIINKRGPVVKVKNGALVLLEVKFQGKKLQRGVDVINGRKMAIGECLK